MEEKILIKSIFAAKTKMKMITAVEILLGIAVFCFLLLLLPIFPTTYYSYRTGELERCPDIGYVAALSDGEWFPLVLFCLGCVTLLATGVIWLIYLIMSKCELVITESSVKGKTLFGKEVILPLYMITAYSTQKFMSTIIVSTASGFTRFAMLQNYEMMGQVLSQKISERQAGVPAQAVPVATAPVAAPSATVDDLLKLKNYLDQGIITQEEFDAKKKQILGL